MIYAYVRIQTIVEIKTVIVVLVRVLPVLVLLVKSSPVHSGPVCEIPYAVYMLASYKHTGGWESFQTVSETVTQTRDFVKDLHNFREFSQILECLDEAMYETRKKCSIAIIK